MEGQSSWISHCFGNTRKEVGEFDSFLEPSDEGIKESTIVSMDLVLPDDLLERILAYLPIVSIFRAGSVCKRWNDIVNSRRFLWNFSNSLSHKPWYFMFTSSDEPIGYAYDPIIRKWYSFELPCIETSNWFIASSCGLVCFMDNLSRSKLYVCNPITKDCKQLEEPPGLKFSDYNALAISVDRMSRSYDIAVVKSKQVPGDFYQWDLSIHVYNSDRMTWVTSVTEVLSGWRGGDESVICDGVLYFLIYSTGGRTPENRHGLIKYDLSNVSTREMLIKTFMPVPCSLTCAQVSSLYKRGLSYTTCKAEDLGDSMGSHQPTVHVLMVCFPGQGHINPMLNLAKRIASRGLLVTFSTTQKTGQMMRDASKSISTTTAIGRGHLRFEFFSDGWDVDDPKRNDLDALMHQLETKGKESLAHLITKQAEDGRPVSCLIGNPFVPWASDVASLMSIPCAVQWVQSVAVFSAYYHYLHSPASFPTTSQPDLSVDLPCVPTLKSDEIPSFLHPSTPYVSLREAIFGQFKNLSKSFCVLVDSFYELEHEVIDYMSQLTVPIKTIGPSFKCRVEAENAKVRGDIWRAADDCLEWLDSQTPGSVVYISFGSVVILKKEQMEELAWGILNSGLPFLWVVRQPDPIPAGTEMQGQLPPVFIEESEGKGKVVQWCPQDQVLSHPSLACFVTHCGWNSSLESLSSGVPVIAFPQWGDQVTDSKFLVDVYGMGVRLGRGDQGGRLASREEVERCVLEATRGPKAEEIKKNAQKWKKAAEEAVAEGGSSDRNLQAFVDDVNRMTFASTP